MKRLLLLGLTTLALGSGCKVVVSGCIRNSDCAAGFICNGGGSCVPSTVTDHTYASCVNNGLCDPGDGCFFVSVPAQDTLGKFCSHECTSATQCEPSFGFQGQCYSLPPDPAQLCYQRCATSLDCFIDNKCATVLVTTGVQDSICMPNNRATP
jgi:hypothetical protein